MPVDSGNKNTIEAIASLPTEFGNFKILAFGNTKDKKEHIALILGNIENQKDVVVRIHSECLTGDVFGSLRCDCRKQLEKALKIIQKHEKGILLYLRQEGRGIGLTNKIKAYVLQDEQGLDTLQANEALGFKADQRDYSIAAELLKTFKVQSIHLLTNNPKKVKELKKFGLKVSKRIPLLTKANKYNKKYLKTKKIRAGHLYSNI